jgi:hypothetical protein
MIETNSGASIQMPQYVCHKTVGALKIAGIERDHGNEHHDNEGSAIITPENPLYAPFRVDEKYMLKHQPEVGGYYVVYEDGYKSFSPAKAFEDGYELTK